MSTGRKIAVDTALLLARSVIQRAIQIPVFIITAKVLGPEGLGLLRLLSIIPTMAKFGTIDFASVTVREVSRNVDENSQIRSSHERNVAYSVNIVWGILLTIGVVIWSFFAQEGDQVAWGIRIGAAGLMLSTLIRLLQANCTLQRDFKLVAQSGMVEVLVNAAVTLSTIWWIGVFAPLLGTLAAGMFQFYWLQSRVGFHIRLAWDWVELRRQAVIAVPLSLGTMLFGAQTWLERVLVGALWGLAGLGHFSFVMTVVATISMLFNNLSHASGVHIYHRLGNREGEVAVGRLVDIPTVTLACLTPAMAAMAVFWVGPIVERFLPGFIPSVPLLPWMAVILWLTPLMNFYGNALSSTRLNQQVASVVLNVATLGLFALGSWLASVEGYGVEGALAARVLALVAGNLTTIALAAPFLHPDPLVTIRKAIWLHLPGLYTSGLIALAPMVGDTLLDQIVIMPALFALLYAPVLVLWERHTGLLRLLLLPLIRKRLGWSGS